MPPRRKSKQTGGLRLCSQKGMKNFEVDRNGSDTVLEAVSASHRANVEVTNDRMQDDKASEGKHGMVAPLKVFKECPQMARITKRSSSTDLPARENVVADNNCTSSAGRESAPSEDADCGFLFLAERVRQEYIKRRATVCGDQDLHQTSMVEHHQELMTQPPIGARRHSPPVGSGECGCTKAVECRQNEFIAVNGEVVNHNHKEAVPAAEISHRKMGNSTSNEQQCLLQQFNDGRLNQNPHNSETSPERTAAPGSVPLPGKMSTTSEYDVPELEHCSGANGLIVLPPPPGFAECGDENLPGTELSSSLNGVLPSPPPEFNDSPNRVRSDFRCRPISTWSVSDVMQWLDSLQLGCHSDSFLAHSVDGRRLVELGRSDLIALGVSQVGQRMILERAIKRAVIAAPTSVL